MTIKDRVHRLLEETAMEIYGSIKEHEESFVERWVPAVTIKNALDLKLSSYPLENKIDNKTGWLFATFARMLQDKDLVEFRNDGSRSFYRTRR